MKTCQFVLHSPNTAHSIPNLGNPNPSRFPSQNDGRQLVYQTFGERLAPNCVQQVRSFGSGGLMVWGGICGDVKTTFVVI